MTTNLEYYKVFYHVARLSSITLAAEQLSVSQPAVSQSMKQLELSLETKLLMRTAKGMKLTSEGEVLFQYIKNGYQQMEMGEKKLKEMLNLEAGEIRIGASDMTLKFFLLPFLEKFHEKYPKIKVKVSNGPTPETLSCLQEGKIDFGVISSPVIIKEDMKIIQVKEIEDVFVAGRKFIQYKNKTLDLQELEKLPLIMLEQNTSMRTSINQFLEENNVDMQPEFELATSDMIVQFALRNLGVGNVMRDFAQEYIESGKLFELRFNKIIPKRHICIITERKNPLSAAASKLWDIILGIESN